MYSRFFPLLERESVWSTVGYLVAKGGEDWGSACCHEGGGDVFMWLQPATSSASYAKTTSLLSPLTASYRSIGQTR